MKLSDVDELASGSDVNKSVSVASSAGCFIIGRTSPWSLNQSHRQAVVQYES